jgi:hypothetical protein
VTVGPTCGTVAAVIALLQAIVRALGSACRSRANLVAENLALRQQLAVMKVGRRPRLRPIDRAFWVVVSQVWSRWVDVLAIVKPATVIAWHRRGYARFWAYKSRRRGRPPLAPEVIELIVRMARDQMVEAMGAEVNAARLIRDRDGNYGRAFDEHVGRNGVPVVPVRVDHVLVEARPLREVYRPMVRAPVVVLDAVDVPTLVPFQLSPLLRR